jgi:hypothetical protein
LALSDILLSRRSSQLSGEKRTWIFVGLMSVFDPSETLGTGIGATLWLSEAQQSPPLPREMASLPRRFDEAGSRNSAVRSNTLKVF